MSNLSLKNIIEWDVLNWSQSLLFWEDEVKLKDKKVLAIGERNGGLSLWAASQGAEVFCSDQYGIKKEVIDWHSQYNFSKYISYHSINALEIPFNDEFFDIVICKSVIGGIKLVHNDPSSRTVDVQKIAIKEIHRVLKKGGSLLGAENMRGSKFHTIVRIILKKNKRWRYLKYIEMDELVNLFEFKKFFYFAVLPTNVKFNFINKAFFILNKMINQFVPDSSKYIVFFHCRK